MDAIVIEIKFSPWMLYLLALLTSIAFSLCCISHALNV